MAVPPTESHSARLAATPWLVLVSPYQTDTAAAIDAAVSHGADWVQLRNKAAGPTVLLRQAQGARAAIAGRARLAINGSVDVALAVGAEAVHLPADGPSVAEVRHRAPDLIVGRSVHSVAEGRVAWLDGASYLLYGHVFATNSKPGLAPRGLNELAVLVCAVRIPVLAIGGISSANARQVLETGCAGVAVMRAILNAPRPAHATTNLRHQLDSASQDIPPAVFKEAPACA